MDYLYKKTNDFNSKPFITDKIYSTEEILLHLIKSIKNDYTNFFKKNDDSLYFSISNLHANTLKKIVSNNVQKLHGFKNNENNFDVLTSDIIYTLFKEFLSFSDIKIKDFFNKALVDDNININFLQNPTNKLSNKTLVKINDLHTTSHSYTNNENFISFDSLITLIFKELKEQDLLNTKNTFSFNIQNLKFNNNLQDEYNKKFLILYQDIFKSFLFEKIDLNLFEKFIQSISTEAYKELILQYSRRTFEVSNYSKELFAYEEFKSFDKFSYMGYQSYKSSLYLDDIANIIKKNIKDSFFTTEGFTLELLSNYIKTNPDKIDSFSKTIFTENIIKTYENDDESFTTYINLQKLFYVCNVLVDIEYLYNVDLLIEHFSIQDFDSNQQLYLMTQSHSNYDSDGDKLEGNTNNFIMKNEHGFQELISVTDYSDIQDNEHLMSFFTEFSHFQDFLSILTILDPHFKLEFSLIKLSDNNIHPHIKVTSNKESTETIQSSLNSLIYKDMKEFSDILRCEINNEKMYSDLSLMEKATPKRKSLKKF